ncbi:MAG: hypothetical protein QOC98_352, partial [Frankiaceae bacterium]|nr:hypothetical protein [Frankiaceae bacterium]
ERPFADWESDDPTPPAGQAWDLVVVGGGTAGLVAAKTAAGFGAGVLLVERDRIGGDCLWTGCVPSKALLHAAHTAADARSAGRLGISAEVRVDFPAVMSAVRAAVAAIEPTDSPSAMRAAGVRVLHGDAQFRSPDSVEVGGQLVRFRQAMVATGSSPVLPPVDGLDTLPPGAVLTNESVFDLTELPDRLLVLGGGSIGCELAQAFARLGSAVTLVESARRLLPTEDADAAQHVHDALRRDGVDLHVGTGVSSFRTAGNAVRVGLAGGSETVVDTVLVAAGRRPRTAGLGLTAAGVELDPRGYVQVDEHLRTTQPSIWSAGDVTGHPQFTHTAGVHGTLVAFNAVLGLRRSVDLATNPRVTYTQPEVAAFGVGSAEAEERGFDVRTQSHDEVDRAIAEGLTAGFSRIVTDRRGRIVGATIVGPRAGESLPELVLAARKRLRPRDLAAATHAYPTYSDGVWKAGIAEATRALHGPAARRVVGVAAAARRRWLAR